MAGPPHHALTAKGADAAAGSVTATDPAAIDPTGADPAADRTTTDTQPAEVEVLSDSSSDERPMPFPAFTEHDELELEPELETELEAQDHAAVDEHEASTTSSIADAASTPLVSAIGVAEPLEPEATVATEPVATESVESAQPGAEPATEREAAPASEQTSEPATEPAPEPAETAEPAQATEAQSDPAPPAVASPPPPLPPPYWTHSHDTRSSTPTTAVDPDRLQVKPSHTTTTTSTTPSAAAAASSSSAAVAAASSSSSAASAPPFPPAHHQHRRDTSSSSSLLHVDLITLQDNEALEQADFNDTTAGAGASSSASASPSPRQQRCWARRVDLTDYVIIGGGSSGANTGSGSAGPKLGAFVVWTVRVETLEGTSFSIHKRYSEFDALRRQLVASFPQATASSKSGGGVAALFGGRRTTQLSGGGSRPGGSSSGPGGRTTTTTTARPPNKSRSRSHSRSRSRKGAPPSALPPLPPKTVLGNFRPAFLEQRRLGLQYFLNCILLNPEFAGSPILRDFLFA